MCWTYAPTCFYCALCDECPGFASFLYANTTREVVDIIMYMDEFTPGNNLRPDKGRSMQAAYCNLFQFPMWFLRDSATWFSLAYITSRSMADTGLSEAHLLRELLTYVLSLGVAPGSCDLRYKYNGRLVCLRLRFLTYLADCKSLFHFAGSRGAAGITPCPVCVNCKKYPADGEIDIYEWDESKFIAHTKQSYNDMADTILLMKANGSPVGKTEEAGKQFGLSLDMQAIPYDKSI